MRFLANENFPLPSVRLLREAGHDVHVRSAKKPLELPIRRFSVVLCQNNALFLPLIVIMA